mmetsp:Transcript_60268/g.176162  ORF Transcript_60268/g.176162 Transcript_60268/m.176162 type:complete len:267 (-) Transcript_60268:3001-3801(-)
MATEGSNDCSAKYICVTGARPLLAAQPSAPSGGSDEKTTAVVPDWRDTSLGSSGPVTTYLMSVLFSATYSSLTQRCAQGCPCSVRSAVHGASEASKGATPVEGQRAQAAASKGALPRRISECQIWSVMVQSVAPYASQLPSSMRCSASRRCLRAATETCPSFTSSDGFMRLPPLGSSSSSGSRTSIMRLSWRMKAGISIPRSRGRKSSRPPKSNDKMTGMPQRALGCFDHHFCTGLCTMCTMKTAVPTRKIKKRGRLMSLCLGQTL